MRRRGCGRAGLAALALVAALLGDGRVRDLAVQVVVKVTRGQGCGGRRAESAGHDGQGREGDEVE